MHTLLFKRVGIDIYITLRIKDSIMYFQTRQINPQRQITIRVLDLKDKTRLSFINYPCQKEHENKRENLEKPSNP